MPDQVSCLETLLDQLRECSEQLAIAHAPGWTDADRHRIGDATSRLSNELCALHDEVSGFAHNLGAERFYAEDQWGRLSQLGLKCRTLAADFLSLEQTVRFRTGTSSKAFLGAELALMVCSSADRLIEQILSKLGKPRSIFVLVSEAERFKAASSAIHLSWTRLTPWHLNRTIHELAHLWAEEYANSIGGAQQAFVEAMQDTWKEPLAKELFADALATYVAGPAYAYSCLFLDFNPSDRRPDETHPSHDERAHCIVIVLERITKNFDQTSQSLMQQATARLKSFWSASREAAGAIEALPNLNLLRDKVEMMVKQLDHEIPEAAYRSLSTAYGVKLSIESAKECSPRGANCVDVLNGAWLSRLNQGLAQESQIATSALRMMTAHEVAHE